ncbi:MAG: DUF1385 domain-containing protein [Candidatus Margulisbacteria bacterium]|nr:DUF1385 domain-containing protein [Candidatus Margulisiibacteriota bacterium]
MGAVGGQALISGVMMKGKDYVSRAVYSENDNLIVDKKKFVSFSQKNKIFGFPFLRGIFNLIDMFRIGMDALTHSIKIAMPNEEQLSKKELGFSFLLSGTISIGLFLLVPAIFFKYLQFSGIHNIFVLNLLEGLIKLTIFLIFLISTLFMKDMREIYRYHGAEHKTVHAYEDKVELTVENVKKYSPIHQRCGTSFIAVLIFVSVVLFSFFGILPIFTRVLLKLLMLPVVAGIAYEIIRLSAKVDKFWYLNIFVWPGIFLQKLTTAEPGDKEIRAAIAALKEVI